MVPASRYVVLGRLGEGSVADILDAVAMHQDGTKQRVLIKRLRCAEDPKAIDAFFDEARVLRKLEHPNIVRLLDAGVHADRALMVFEFVSGQSLARVLERLRTLELRVPESIALQIVALIAQALGHAHQLPGLRAVHRDVTPSNILLSWEGDVVLVDFGIALFEHRAERTQAGIVRGKLAYMSPEQLSGSDLDARTDVFSLGCVLHELLSGRSPLADPVDREAVLLGQAPKIDTEITGPVRDLLERSLAVDRRTRPRDGADFARSVAAISTAPASSEGRVELARWLLTLVSAGESTRLRPSPLDETYELALTTPVNDRRDFARVETSSETLSQLLSFIDGNATGETEPAEVTEPRRPPTRARSKPSMRTKDSGRATLLLAGLGLLLASMIIVGVVERRVPDQAPKLVGHLDTSAARPMGSAKLAAVPGLPEPVRSSTEAAPIEAPLVVDTTRPRSAKRRVTTNSAKSATPRDSEASSKTAGATVEPALESAPLDARSVDRALEGVRKALVQAKVDGVSAKHLAAFERAYLDLSTDETQASGEAQRRRLMQRIQGLQQRVAELSSTQKPANPP